jgi:hypothetical protein
VIHSAEYGLRRGLSAAGFAEGRDVAFDYRWTADQPDRLLAVLCFGVSASRGEAAFCSASPNSRRPDKAAARRFMLGSWTSLHRNLKFFDGGRPARTLPRQRAGRYAKLDHCNTRIMARAGKKRGRPARPGGRDPVTSLRMPRELMEAIDEWRRRQRDSPLRGEAIRRLIALSLGPRSWRSNR